MTALNLKVQVTGDALESLEGDALVLAVGEGGVPQKSLSLLGEAGEVLVRQVLHEGWMSGKAGEALSLPMPAASRLRIARLILVGMGKEEKLKMESLRALGAQMVGLSNRSKIATLFCLMPMDKLGDIKRPQVVEGLAEGALLGSYQFDEFKGEEAKKEDSASLKRLSFLVREKDRDKAKEVVETARLVAEGVFFARDLANRPGNVVTPGYLAREAKELAKQYAIKTTVMDEKELEKKGMGGILAVGQGSANAPCLIVMEYKKGGDKPVLAVVGKAVTFDSGGLSLKPPPSQEEMKFDMSGGAAVFGLMRVLGEAGWPVNVVGIVPAAENMPSGSAQRPGDVIKTLKGITVEVLNTDAEGRLILADALHHAETFNPEIIIDLATLTGACVVALGGQASGLMSNDTGLIGDLRTVGEESGERVWPLPMFDEYQEQIKSQVADIKNIGSREAGTITAACFLSRFVGEKRRWAHLDIAGTAWDLKSGKPHVPKGATGVGVRLLTRFIRSRLQ